MCWSFLPNVRFLILLTVFELLPKTCNFTICSIFSNSDHVGWCTASPDTILKLDTLVMIQTKFGFHWSCTFRGEDFWKSLRRITTTDDDDGRQVMAIAHMTLWVRWAKNKMNCKLMLTYDTPALRQTGSRNLTGKKTLPTIWGTYMKLVTKHQISAINSCWEKCDEKCAYTNVC